MEVVEHKFLRGDSKSREETDQARLGRHWHWPTVTSIKVAKDYGNQSDGLQNVEYSFSRDDLGIDYTIQAFESSSQPEQPSPLETRTLLVSFAAGTSIAGLVLKKLRGRNETFIVSTGILSCISALISNTQLTSISHREVLRAGDMCHACTSKIDLNART